MHVWHGLKNGKLFAKGLEFGTTSSGTGRIQSYERTIKNSFHGVDNIELIDAGGSITKRYLCFLMKISGDFKAVDDIIVEDQKLRIKYRENEEVKETYFNVMTRLDSELKK